MYVCNVFSVALNIGAALSIYVAAKRLFEKRWAATGASILYTLASYRVVNVFTRIAFGEALAMVFLPLFLVNLYDVVCGDARRWKGLALSAACIFCSHMITTLFCAVLAAGFCLLHIRKIILQKRLLPLVKAVLVCLLLCLYRIGPLVMYSMQGLGADDLFRNITEFSVELGQVLLMNAGTITRETNNPQIMEFSVEIGLPLMIGAALALYAVLQKEERGKSEWAALKLVAGGALMTIAATDFFPWGAVSLLTQGQVGYIQFTWRLLILATPMLALAGGYGLCEFGGKRQDAAAVAALSMAVICVMPIFSSEIQNPIYVEKGVIISPFMGRSFPEYTYSDTTDFLAIRKRPVEIDGDAEMADYEKRSTTITAQVSARAESRITFPLFDYDGFRATVDGREIAVERGSNNRVSVVLPAGTSGALKIWFAGKGWWRVGDAVSAATLIGLLFWMKKGRRKHVGRTEKSIVDAIEEGQLKTKSYREETIRLYYPLSSLCTLMHQSMDAAQMTRALTTFSEQAKGELGEIEVSRKGERFCLAVGPKGAAWVHEHTDPSGFLADFIAAIGRHGCTMDELLAIFRRHGGHVHVEALHNGEFDWLVYFEDGKPDAYCYCIADEGCHLTYHRFTKEDYEAFGFETT